MGKRLVSHEAEKKIGNAANLVWQYIGFDILDAVKRETGRDSVPRSDVAELVIDCDRLREELDDATRVEWDALDYGQKQRVVKRGLPCEQYGL